MSTATLMFNLLAGTVGAVAVWLAARGWPEPTGL